MNYYPLNDTSDKYELRFLLSRWKANGLFPGLIEWEVVDLIRWHSQKGYIKPFYYHGGQGKHLTNGISDIAFNDQYQQLTVDFWGSGSFEPDKSDYILLQEVFLKPNDVKSIESGNFEKLNVNARRLAVFNKFREEYKQQLPGELTQIEIWMMLNDDDPNLFKATASSSTMEKFYEHTGLIFKPGRR